MILFLCVDVCVHICLISVLGCMGLNALSQYQHIYRYHKVHIANERDPAYFDLDSLLRKYTRSLSLL